MPIIFTFLSVNVFQHFSFKLQQHPHPVLIVALLWSLHSKYFSVDFIGRSWSITSGGWRWGDKCTSGTGSFKGGKSHCWHLGVLEWPVALDLYSLLRGSYFHSLVRVSRSWDRHWEALFTMDGLWIEWKLNNNQNRQFWVFCCCWQSGYQQVALVTLRLRATEAGKIIKEGRTCRG